jgi:hypothetical protein
MDDAARRRVRLKLTAFVVLVLIPATWLLVGAVKESIFHRRANDFIAQNFGGLPGVDIVSQRITYSPSGSTIEVFLAGDSIPVMLEGQLQARMASAGLKGSALELHKPQNLAGELGRLSGELRVGIVQDLYERQAALLAERDQRIRTLEANLSTLTASAIPMEQIAREVAVQYPLVDRLSFGKVVQARRAVSLGGGESGFTMDTIPTVLVAWRSGSASQRARDQATLAAWLRVRLGLDTIQVVGG